MMTKELLAAFDARLDAMAHAQFAEIKRVYPPEIEAAIAEATKCIKEIYVRHFAALHLLGRPPTGPERLAVARAASAESEPIRRALIDLDQGAPFVVTVPKNHPWATALAREARSKAACTCGGDPEQPHHHHDISCPATFAPSPRAEP